MTFKYIGTEHEIDRQHAQQNRNAEHILEEILGRQNWAAPVRDSLARSLVLVADGRALRDGGEGADQRVNAAFILERVLCRRAWPLELQGELAQALVRVAAGKSLRNPRHAA
jgi:hypothetical protein